MSYARDRDFMWRVHYLMVVELDIRKSDDNIFFFLAFFPQVDPNSHL